MARRILLTLCIAALGLAAWWITHQADTPPEGLVVHVQVRDAAGASIPGAQVQAVYAPGWRQLGKDGRERLTNVLLRAEEEPSAEAIGAALQVRAPFFTQRRGSAPTIQRSADGSWEASFQLQHHGVFRLSVAETHLGSIKAFLEPDEHWEAMDRGNVARPDAPATYRIYPGMKWLIVRVVGEPDKNGVVQAATRRHVFAVPAPGFIVDETVEAGPVKPILGTIAAPEGAARPPSLAGLVSITEITEDGARLDLGEIKVDHSGSFVLRTLGEGDYELEASSPWLEAIEPELVRGGGTVTLTATAVRPWLEVTHPGVERAQDVDTRFTFEPGGIAAPEDRLYAKTWTVIALPQDATPTSLVVEVPGTDANKPMSGRAELGSLKAGANPLEVVLSERPHGQVVVRIARAALKAAGGATVRIGAGRETTLIAKLAEEALFKNVATGEVSVTVEWNLDDKAASTRSVLVKPGEATVVEFDHDV